MNNWTNIPWKSVVIQRTWCLISPNRHHFRPSCPRSSCWYRQLRWWANTAMTKKWRKSILKKKSNLIQGKNGESRRSTVIRSTAEMEWKIKEKKKNFPQLTDLQILWMHDQWPMTGLSIHIHPVQLFSLFFIQFFFFWTVSYLVQLICDWNWTICINFDVKQLKFAQICTIWMWKSKFLTNLDIKNQILIHFDLKQQKFGQICTFFTLKLKFFTWNSKFLTNFDIQNKIWITFDLFYLKTDKFRH